MSNRKTTPVQQLHDHVQRRVGAYQRSHMHDMQVQRRTETLLQFAMSLYVEGLRAGWDACANSDTDKR